MKMRRTISPEVYRAMLRVPRASFLPPDEADRAAEDHALPIGWGQTISQPSLVAWMTELLAFRPGSRVLEIGTGSGFQTAILAELGAEVWTIERIGALGELARGRLDNLGYRQVHYRVGDGALGWPEASPFDAIIVTAGARRMPPALVAQLAVGGRIVAPVSTYEDAHRWGEDGGSGAQVLVRGTKQPDGSLKTEELCPVIFVPLVTDT